MKEYSEKGKYLRGFKKCTLTLYDYARKMNINPEELKRCLKEDDGSSVFGKIEMSDIVKTPLNILSKRT